MCHIQQNRQVEHTNIFYQYLFIRPLSIAKSGKSRMSPANFHQNPAFDARNFQFNQCANNKIIGLHLTIFLADKIYERKFNFRVHNPLHG